MSIDIAEFIDAELERSVRAERARERRELQRTPGWQQWLGLAPHRSADEAERD